MPVLTMSVASDQSMDSSVSLPTPHSEFTGEASTAPVFKVLLVQDKTLS